MGCLENRAVSGFGFAQTIEEQRVIRSTSNGEEVQPRITVGDAPEGHAGDGIAVFEKGGKKFGVTICELLLNLIW